MANIVNRNQRKLPRISASWAGTSRINLRLPGQVMTLTYILAGVRSNFNRIEAERSEHSGKWNKLSVWMECKFVKFTSHFTGLVDFQFVEFQKLTLDGMGLEDIEIHFYIK